MSVSDLMSVSEWHATTGEDALEKPPGESGRLVAEPVGADPVGADPVGADPVGADPVGAEPVEELARSLGDRAVWLQRDLGWDGLVEEARRLGPDPDLAELSNDEVEGSVCGIAAELAAMTARWLDHLCEFVVRGIWADQGARTPAQWLSWKVGLAPSTAREHVRVALRLRELPKVRRAFAQGELSYSKVRAMTRIAVPEIEDLVLQWADVSTAAQLERVAADFRTTRRAAVLPGDGDDPDDPRYSWRTRSHADGTMTITIRGPAEECAELCALLERRVQVARNAEHAGDGEHVEDGGDAGDAGDAGDCGDCGDAGDAGDAGKALDRSGSGGASAEADTPQVPQDEPSPPVAPEADAAPLDGDGEAAPFGDGADAAPLDGDGEVALCGSGSDPALCSYGDGSSAFDRVDASAEASEPEVEHSPVFLGSGRPAELVQELVNLVAQTDPEVLTDTSGLDRHTLVLHASLADLHGQYPGRIPVEESHGRVRGLDREVLRTLACEAGLVLAVVDDDGTPLDIGRRSRQLTAAQRRALVLRDRTCRFPGCDATRHLHAHHIEHWVDGGPTDLANLVLLCAHHHRFVHRCRLTVELCPGGAHRFVTVDGATIERHHPLRLDGERLPRPDPNELGDLQPAYVDLDHPLERSTVTEVLHQELRRLAPDLAAAA